MKFSNLPSDSLKQAFIIFSVGCCGTINMARPRAIALEVPLHKQVTARSPHLSVFTASGNAESDGDWGEPHTGSQSTTGGRDYCPAVEQGMVALSPQTNWGQTISVTPTLWFYVPYAADQMAYGEFILLNEMGEDHILPIRFTIATAGLVSITLPLSSTLLDPGTDYNWAFQLYCNENQSTPLNLEGWLRYTPPNVELTTTLETNIPDYQTYWDAGIWFDAIDDLMQKRSESPDDRELEALLQALLEDGGVNLPESETIPIVGPVLPFPPTEW